MKSNKPYARVFQPLSLFLLLALLVTACSPGGIPVTGGSQGEPAVMTLEVSDTAITAPQQAPTGLTTVTLHHTGQKGISVSLAQLNTDVTLDQFMQTFEQDDLEAVSLVTLYGGRDATPGVDKQFTISLPEGTYVALGFAEEEGPPLVTSFQVTGEPAAEVSEPTADVAVDLQDFAFNMPDQVTTGEQVWGLRNSGEQWHELLVVKPEPGFTQEQFLEMINSDEEMSGPPPFEDVAFFGPVSQNVQGWMDLDLEPGTYWALCFLPDFATGTSHVEMGMIKEFEVVSE